MIRCMTSEMQKMKRTFALKLTWAAPIVTLLLCAAVGGGQNGAYNWWYTMLLPGALTVMCSAVVQKDAKMKYRSILSMPIDKKKIWLGKILACSKMYLISCIVFMIGVSILGAAFGQTLSHTQSGAAIPIINSIEGSLLLFITFLWQIPFCMLLSNKCGMFVTILINMAGNIIGVAGFADKKIWLAMPYSIPTRLMCPVLHILPNSIVAKTGDPLLNSSVVLLGVLISIALFVFITILSMVWFDKQEAK